MMVKITDTLAVRAEDISDMAISGGVLIVRMANGIGHKIVGKNMEALQQEMRLICQFINKEK